MRKKVSAGKCAVPAKLAKLAAIVFDDPRDLGARAVYGDALLEAGDPRGELIVLQLARGLHGKPTSEERALLKAHWASFVGPLAPLLDKRKSTFENGFLHTAVLNAYREAIPPEVVSMPDWRTVEVLGATGLHEFGHADEPPRLVARIPQLRELHTDTETLPALTESVPGHRLERLRVFLARPDLSAVRALFEARTFPELRSLALWNHTPSSDQIGDVLERAPGTLEELRLFVRVGALAAMSKMLERLAGSVARVAIESRDLDLTLARAPAGQHDTSALVLTVCEVRGRVDELDAMLEDLGRARVRLVAGGKSAKVKAAMRALGGSHARRITT